MDDMRCTDFLPDYLSLLVRKYLAKQNMSMAALAREANVNVKTIRDIVDVKTQRHRIDIIIKLFEIMQQDFDTMYLGLQIYSLARCNSGDKTYAKILKIVETIEYDEEEEMLQKVFDCISNIQRIEKY